MSGAVTPLVIIGAGGFARETADAVVATNDRRPTWDLWGFLDDDPALTGRRLGGIEVLGGIDQIVSRLADAEVVVCIGRPDSYFSRLRIVRRLGIAPERYATVVHPTVSVPRTAVIGRGTVMLAGVVVTTTARIGDHVAVMPSSVITHDDVIDDYATIASGVMLGGFVHVHRGAYLGAGSLVREDLEIGDWSLVGMGSVVTRSIPAAEQWFGSPARHRGDIEVPDDVR